MLRVVFSSSKVIISRSCPLFSCFLTPSIFFRIEPILALEFQAAQPGMVNWTILSAAKAKPEKEIKKITAKNIDNVLFIIHLVLIIFSYNNSMTINMQLQFAIDRRNLIWNKSSNLITNTISLSTDNEAARRRRGGVP
jgi:hypothetical protein